MRDKRKRAEERQVQGCGWPPVWSNREIWPTYTGATEECVCMCVCVSVQKAFTVHIPPCCSFLSTHSVQCANYKAEDLFLNWRGRATSRSFARLIGLSVTSNTLQTSPCSPDYGCQAAKVEWGCEAGEFKEFSRVLPVKKQAQCRFMKVWLSEALFIFAALSFGISLQSRFLQ